MAQPVHTQEPAVVTAGDTLTWKRSLGDYPAGTWTLKYRLINSAGKYDISASADGTDHLVSVTAATSATYTAGDYTWQAYVEKGTGPTLERATIGTGRITVKPNLAAQTGGYDTRTTAKKTLDLLDAAMVANGASAWTQEYEIAGRRMKFRNAAEFMAYRSKVVAEVAREEAAERMALGLGSKSKVLVRF